MTGTSFVPDQCPLCDSEELEYRDEISSWTCEGCSYVFDGDGASEDISSLATATQTDESGQDETEDWKETINARDKSEANLIDVLNKIEEVAEELRLSEEVEIRAAELVTEAWKLNFMLGRTKTDTVAAAVYAAAREYSESIPPALIAGAVGTQKRRVKDFYTSMKTELDLELPAATPEEFVPAISAELEANNEIKRAAIELLNQSGPVGGNPVAIAAAAVYEASNDRRQELTQREIAVAVDVTKETIWRHCKKFDQ
jgi:transcription initiation factor TFIIIB Brf1 subunit/transcription initiation factor TFIIB